MDRSAFCHEALFYGSDEEFLMGIMPLLREGLEVGEPALVAVGHRQTELLRGELGEDAAEVGFVDMREVGRNPARIITVWRDFLDRAPDDGSLRGIGEPVWPGRSEAELDECRRHEALLNVAFPGDREWTLLCPYDSSALEDDVLAAVCESHPRISSDGIRVESAAWQGPQAQHSPFEGSLPPAPAHSTTLDFGREELAGARGLIADEAAHARLSRDRGADLVVAVGELAANSVLHGGGAGSLRVWHEPDALVVEVRDGGRIEEPLAGRLRPALEQERGRGLWMVNQLCDLVQVRSGREGTGVRLRMGLS